MKLYLALRLSKSFKIGCGEFTTNISVEDKDIAGFCYAFKSKAAAVRMHGKGVEVQCIELKADK